MKILAGEQSVTVGTTAIRYELAFSKRKTIGIRIFPDGRVSVTAPTGLSKAEIDNIVLKRADWIVRHQKKFQSAPRPIPVPRRYVNGETYQYLGKPYTLSVIEDRSERVELGESALTVFVAQASNTKRIAALIERWYRIQAEQIFTARLAACFPRVHFITTKMPMLTIRTMKTRWGSCTSKGRVTLNRKLLHMSDDLIDYVILHELCHLKEMNHSPRFYALMDRVLPNWRECRKRLNTNAVG
jgi:predicted metal-dependent hydrolase